MKNPLMVGDAVYVEGYLATFSFGVAPHSRGTIIAIDRKSRGTFVRVRIDDGGPEIGWISEESITRQPLDNALGLE